ncbi:MAG TPA: TatD family hydrolase [Acidimicrobiales bacterium]|nr:TatD family hydrolase [Acidimicrobiales bacterium]
MVREAVDAGVNALVCVGTDASTSREAVELVRSLKDSGLEGSQSEDGSRGVGAFDAWATVGLHPHEASKGTHEIEEVLDRVLEQEPGMVVAVGECGLDYHYDHSPRDSQREAFAKQISLANRLGLALVVHSRSAWDDTLAVLKSEGVPQRTVMHCFTGGTEEARRCLDLGAFLSFSGIVTFKGAADVRAAARFCPSERLLVETDAPFLAPVPHRGATNRPAWVSLVGEAIARERGVAPQTLATSSTAAAYALFRPE